MDILELFKQYLEENYNTEGDKNTINAYYSDVKQFINFFKENFGEDIIVFSRGSIIEYKNYLINTKRRKYTSINRKIASLSVYEDFLIEKEIKKDGKKVIRKSDYYKIDLPLITSEMLPQKTIKKVRIKSGNTNPRDYLMFVMLDELGLRISELIKLELDRDIDMKNRKIVTLGKGMKVRELFMNDIIYEAIEDYLTERDKLLNGRENKYLFISNKTANTNKHMLRNSINNILNKYCQQIKEDKINPHIFRHHCATTKYEEGYSDIRLKKVLGQSSNVTERYVHTGGEHIQKN